MFYDILQSTHLFERTEGNPRNLDLRDENRTYDLPYTKRVDKFKHPNFTLHTVILISLF
jgi:hypothetical protein